MNEQTRRRAALQRRLAMSAVPRPPEGLAERIKGDIPESLSSDADRASLVRRLRAPFGIAASLLLLVTSLLVAVRLLDTEQKTTPTMAAARRAVAPIVLPATEAAPATAAPESAQPESAVPQTAENTTASAAAERAPTVVPQRMVALAAPPSDRVATKPEPQREGEVEGDAAPDEIEERGLAVGTADAARATEMAAAAPPPPPPAAAGAPAAAAKAQAAPMRRESSIVNEAYGSELALAPKATLFGISIDPTVFPRMKTAIENGRRPDPSDRDVESLVNYFAGAPSRRLRQGVRLEVEASPAAVASPGEHGVVRFTIDTAPMEVARGASVPPVAKNATLDVEFDDNAVESFRRVGGDDAVTAESTLLHNVSVTGLYEVTLRPSLEQWERVATVRLRFVSVADGRAHTIEEVVHGRDFAKSWSAASRRHRLATLGALWGETLRGAAAAGDVAKRAEELATQNPDDTRARELADVASASAKQ